ncbi:spike base protein, RCAP_Rcc01079 family [Sphingomonas sp. XXL09]|uniref:spike base protein, RCAP_Rcc01079 family n=1 Tax=Sphingomonas sp. XXL09 TaxID=3457787 RepID=UPI00406BD310
MDDHYKNVFSGVGDPGTAAAEIIPSDGTDLDQIPKGIYVGSAGDIAMIGVGDLAGSTGVIWRNVPAGALIPYRPRRILATGTTAADLVAIR